MSNTEFPNIDYSFMGVGGLFERIVHLCFEASRRFGAEAMTVIHVYVDLRDNQDLNTKALLTEMKHETRVHLSGDDLAFLDRVYLAKTAIDYAKNLLKGDL